MNEKFLKLFQDLEKFEGRSSKLTSFSLACNLYMLLSSIEITFCVLILEIKLRQNDHTLLHGIQLILIEELVELSLALRVFVFAKRCPRR